MTYLFGFVSLVATIWSAGWLLEVMLDEHEATTVIGHGGTSRRQAAVDQWDR